uniref:Uncharacterized protein n=1 Tax=Oryza meridionalis TaxID=40149 RepID=A0A0E0D6N4_9ORYZ
METLKAGPPLTPRAPGCSERPSPILPRTPDVSSSPPSIRLSAADHRRVYIEDGDPDPEETTLPREIRTLEVRM